MSCFERQGNESYPTYTKSERKKINGCFGRVLKECNCKLSIRRAIFRATELSGKYQFRVHYKHYSNTWSHTGRRSWQDSINRNLE